MNKRLSFLFILIFTFQIWANADDISEFQIEGMSIGDSALDYFSESEIKSNTKHLYKSKLYAMFCKNLKNSNFEAVCIEFKDNGEYIIASLIGKIFYNNKDFNECFTQEASILAELKNLFTNNAIYKDHGIEPHEGDPSGESKGSWHTFTLDDDSGWVYLECMNWAEDMVSYDNLKITVLGTELGIFLRTDAY